jgi:hypothetical protein
MQQPAGAARQERDGTMREGRRQCSKRGGDSTISRGERDGGAMREEVMQQPTSTRGVRPEERDGGATREGIDDGVARRRTMRMTTMGDSITASAMATTTTMTATTATMATTVTMVMTAASSRGATWDTLSGKLANLKIRKDQWR